MATNEKIRPNSAIVMGAIKLSQVFIAFLCVTIRATQQGTIQCQNKCIIYSVFSQSFYEEKYFYSNERLRELKYILFQDILRNI